MAAPDKDEDVTVDLATTIILKPGNVNDQSVGYASGIAGEVVNGSMTLPNGITIVAFYLTGRTLVIEANGVETPDKIYFRVSDFGEDDRCSCTYDTERQKIVGQYLYSYTYKQNENLIVMEDNMEGTISLHDFVISENFAEIKVRGAYVEVGGKAADVTNIYIGVDGTVHRVVKDYVGAPPVPHVLTVHVVGPDSSSMEGATVEVFDPEKSDSSLGSGLTLSDGMYSLVLPNGTFVVSVKVSKTGYNTVTQQYRKFGETLEIALASSVYYTLTYQTDGGTNYPSERYKKGTVVQLTKRPVKADYDFAGWYLSTDSNQAIIETVTMDGFKTVVAKWQDKE